VIVATNRQLTVFRRLRLCESIPPLPIAQIG
jgi:hypothetical protein